MVARIAPLAVVVLVLVVGCHDDPVEVLRPDVASRSLASGSAGSGIFHGAEPFIAGNPMLNFAGGAPYNYGYYSDGPDPGSGVFDSDSAYIHVPHDARLALLTDFSFEAWIRPSPNDDYKYSLIAMNSASQFSASGQNDFGYFLLDYWQHPRGPGPDFVNRIDIYWTVPSYHIGGWSGIGVDGYEVKAPSPDPEVGAELHVVGVHANDVISLYINGQVVATADISGVTGGSGRACGPSNGMSGFRQDLSDLCGYAGESNRPLSIAGAGYWVNEPEKYLGFSGSIGESAFYRRALTAQEIQAHYQVGTATPPAAPDELNDPYRDLVLSHAPAGYWRHREAELHGLASIDGERVVDASGNAWHGLYREAGTAETCAITLGTVAGPNPMGSFVMRDEIRMSAETTGCDGAVEWVVEDDPTDDVASIVPDPIGAGAELTWEVPAHDSARWATVGHPGSLSEKSLAYRVSARVSQGGQLIGSDTVDLRQDETDTAREEYLEYGRARTPGRAEFGVRDTTHFSRAELNFGDYSVHIATDALLGGLVDLRAALGQVRRQETPLVLTSAFRNPVHHRVHAGAVAAESQHQYGTAADLRIRGYDEDPEDFFYLIFRATRRLGACFEPEETIRAGNAAGALTHAHVDWRGRCERGW